MLKNEQRRKLMDQQTKLLCLAHLKNGEKPADAAEFAGISYAAALKLKKELHAAEERGKILELFDIDKASLEILLEGVKKQMVPAIDAFDIGEEVEEAVHGLAESASGGNILNTQLQDSASAIAKKITTVAMAANNADTLLSLSKALCEIQRAFFANEIGGANGAAGIPLSSFEQHLKN